MGKAAVAVPFDRTSSAQDFGGAGGAVASSNFGSGSCEISSSEGVAVSSSPPLLDWWRIAVVGMAGTI